MKKRSALKAFGLMSFLLLSCLMNQNNLLAQDGFFGENQGLPVPAYKINYILAGCEQGWTGKGGLLGANITMDQRNKLCYQAGLKFALQGLNDSKVISSMCYYVAGFQSTGPLDHLQQACLDGALATFENKSVDKELSSTEARLLMVGCGKIQYFMDQVHGCYTSGLIEFMNGASKLTAIKSMCANGKYEEDKSNCIQASFKFLNSL